MRRERANTRCAWQISLARAGEVEEEEEEE